MADVCNMCGLPIDVCSCQEIAREQLEVSIKVERRRYGKMVTVVEGFEGSNDVDLPSLARKLKTTCASGGTVKGCKIEIQGDHKRRLSKVLRDMGFNVKSS